GKKSNVGFVILSPLSRHSLGDGGSPTFKKSGVLWGLPLVAPGYVTRGCLLCGLVLGVGILGYVAGREIDRGALPPLKLLHSVWLFA
ncbi:MAG: hypothetical protein J6R00_08175, partial [Lentisphaeria bacterium]|nr:hypothetical protein [Lentisphaeria bacterium]